MKPKPKPVVLPRSDRLTEKARKLLQTALTNIVRMPKTFNMNQWLLHDPKAKRTRRYPAPYCGTIACLAGHIVLAADGDNDLGSTEAEHRAIKLLGISSREAMRLFYPNLWPDPVSIDDAWAEITPAQLVARVMTWIRTGT